MKKIILFVLMMMGMQGAQASDVDMQEPLDAVENLLRHTFVAPKNFEGILVTTSSSSLVVSPRNRNTLWGFNDPLALHYLNQFRQLKNNEADEGLAGECPFINNENITVCVEEGREGKICITTPDTLKGTEASIGKDESYTELFLSQYLKNFYLSLDCSSKIKSLRCTPTVPGGPVLIFVQANFDDEAYLTFFAGGANLEIIYEPFHQETIHRLLEK